jgi:acyl-CoA thioesterase I
MKASSTFLKHIATAGVCGFTIAVASAPADAQSATAAAALPSFNRDQNAAPSSSAERTIVIIGDSLASGYGVGSDESYPSLLQKWIRDLGWKDQVINAGVSGSTTTDGRSRIGSVLRRKTDVLVIALGGNDFLRGIDPDAIKQNLISMIQQTRQKYPRATCVLAGMEVPPLVGGDYVDKYNALFADVAARTDCMFVPGFLNGVMGVPGMTLGDQIHPTVAGQKLLAEHLWSMLKPLLQARR